MTPTVLSAIFLVVIFLRYFFIERPKEKQNASKIYTLTRKDVGRIVQYGAILGILVMLANRVLDQTVGTDSYWFVFWCGLLYLVAEVIYNKVAVPFLVRREVSRI